MRRMWMRVLSVSLLIVLAACGGNTGSAPTGNEGEKTSAQETASTGKTASAEETASSEKPIKLTYAFFAPASTFPAKQMEKWKEELEKRTNGKVDVELFFGGTLLTDKNMYDGVKNGVADIGSSVTTYEPGKFPLLTIAEAPTIFQNSLVASKVVYDLIKEFPPDAFKNVKLITAFTSEPSFIQMKDPITGLKDLKGKQVRVPGALAPVLKELGASPVGMSQSETLEAIQTGVVEGYVSSREVLMDLKFAEMVKYLTDYPLTVSIHAAVMNMDTWNSLPPDVQKVIDELGPEMAAWTGNYLDTHVKEAVDWSIKEQGLQIVSLTPEEKEAWDAKMKPFQDKTVADLKAKGLPAEEFKQRLDELKALYSN
ncbi:TRAP transporter substrate-binding protein [Paenibacillus beijingensis]|uniref:C4-dicarboxylate ABC transporter substrate-binding protein n=1 Tax=Paenibacillus beijingensis TaxID=1126833 RepID=A0A0D5NKU0_9BACL|nr:TRAP transporter substrate-binding protein [Paenibacillus beijingensis]AJY75969.1 C4-dicarboxylate ABC transporter substrate-binding protein [Paenibacillus beijingensis]